MVISTTDSYSEIRLQRDFVVISWIRDFGVNFITNSSGQCYSLSLKTFMNERSEMMHGSY